MGIEQICVGIVVIIILILVFLLEATVIDFCCGDAGGESGDGISAALISACIFLGVCLTYILYDCGVI